MGDHPLLVEWHGSISRSVWEFVEGFLEGISRLLFWLVEAGRAFQYVTVFGRNLNL